MAKNDISAAIAHLRMSGWEIKYTKGKHTYLKKGKYGDYIIYSNGTWSGNVTTDEFTIDLLNDLTIRPKRYNDRKLTLCEGIIRMADGEEIYPNIFKVENKRIQYYKCKNQWMTTGFFTDKNHVKNILSILNEIMDKPYDSKR